MVIEILYKELYIYGEEGNANYLEMMFKDETIVNTGLLDKPYFVDYDVDILYLGPMAEPNLERVYGKLLPYKERLLELIEKGVTFFIFNNAMDIVAKNLEVVGGDKASTLGLFNIKSVRDYNKRKSEVFLGEYERDEFIGIQMGFSQYYGNDGKHLYNSRTSKAFNEHTNLGGFRYKNCFLIECVGVIFALNPPLSKRILRAFNKPERLPYEDTVQKAYVKKLQVCKDDKAFNKRYQESKKTGA